ncbi:hypothetical protein BLJAPNOD_02927 [Ensifer sp. M14]|uniref:hypothetical protein n=1 Tax=Ensifer sp. M14 TaxID=2203782 RepID=UPI000E1C9239|nr:hypothetical protein [Ensifer sp. M14]RDL51786.1 hypothetical protein BLJAPNOD_02927 [Ensifer sp. M14]
MSATEEMLPGPRRKQRRRQSDLFLDLKGLLAFAFPKHFFKFTGPASYVRAVAGIYFCYGFYLAINGYLSARPFADYDYSFFLVLSAIPALIVASRMEGRKNP